MNLHDMRFSGLRLLARQSWMTRPLDLALAPFNPFNPRRHSDPYPMYREARAAGGVFYNRLAKMWMVTGYEEAIEVMRGPVSVDRSKTLAPSRPYNKMKEQNVELLLSNMLMSDAPDHGRLRRLVSRAFTPRAIADLHPRVDELTAELIGQLTENTDHTGSTGHTAGPTAGVGRRDLTVDVMATVADRLPIYVIGELLGIPRPRWEELKELSDVVAKFVDPFSSFDPRRMDQAIDRLREMLDTLATERAAEPGDDLITALVRAEADGQRLDREELVSMVILLLIAGHDTTSSLIGNALVALGRNPEQRRMLLEPSTDRASAVDEFLRYDSPIQVTDRTAVESFVVGGKTIPAGSLILILIGAANRDPEQYRDPARLQLDRLNPRPISFGHGIHHCIGAALARMEAAALVPAFVAAFPDYEVDELGLRWKHSTTFRGPAVLPISLNPLSRAGVGRVSTEHDGSSSQVAA